MNTIIKPTIVLGAVALIASLVLSPVYNITKPRIESYGKEKQQKAVSKVLPGYNNIEVKKISHNGTEFQYWKGEEKQEDPDKVINEDDKIYGYAFLASKPGYSGDIKTMVGIDNAGKVMGILIVQQTETPGLGSKCEEVESKQTFVGTILNFFTGSATKEEDPAEPWFQEQYKGLDLNKDIQILQKGNWKQSMKEELLEKNAITAITGATITSRTVNDSIKAAIEILKQYEEIIPAEAEASK